MAKRSEFSTKVKKELLSIEIENECCMRAITSGMAIFARSCSINSMYLKTESQSVAKRYSDLINYLTGIETHNTKTESGVCKAVVASKNDREIILNEFGHSAHEFSLRVNRSNFEDECCLGAFLRGAFLACGMIAQPDREYHLEFSVQFAGITRDLKSILDEVGIHPKEMIRKGYRIIYFKESESIEDLLTFMGATNSALELMNIKIYKDFRNKVNRVINCETANISRTVNAASVQIDAINRLIAGGLLDKLPDDLQEVARIRLENPEMSLREIGESMSTPLSRSAVNNRIRKLLNAAESASDNEIK